MSTPCSGSAHGQPLATQRTAVASAATNSPMSSSMTWSVREHRETCAHVRGTCHTVLRVVPRHFQEQGRREKKKERPRRPNVSCAWRWRAFAWRRKRRTARVTPQDTLQATDRPSPLQRDGDESAGRRARLWRQTGRRAVRSCSGSSRAGRTTAGTLWRRAVGRALAGEGEPGRHAGAALVGGGPRERRATWPDSGAGGGHRRPCPRSTGLRGRITRDTSNDRKPKVN